MPGVVTDVLPSTLASIGNTAPPDDDTPATPAAAAAAGYTALAFSDEFDSLATINTSNTAGTGYNWSSWIPFEGKTMPASCFTQGSWTDSAGSTSSSVLTIVQNRWNWNQALYSVDARNGDGFSQQYGYFEARLCHPAEQVVSGTTNPSSPAKSGLADTPASPLGWPSWWSLAKRHLMFAEMTVDGTTDYLELDFHEYYDSAAQDSIWGNRLTGTVHDWHGGNDWRNTDGHQYGSHISDPAAWHTYGCLWEPGKFTWYLDGVQQHSIAYSADAAPVPNNTTNGYVMPSGTYRIADLDNSGIALALGTGNGYPMHVDWVRVWR